ncbi:MAG: hypothetical protein ACOX3K_02920 [Bacilli bacterium]
MIKKEIPVNLIIQKGGKKEAWPFCCGVNHLAYENKKIFTTLLIKDQSFYNIELQIAGESLFPREEKDKTIFMLMINSQNIVMHACFVFNEAEREQRMKKIEERLLTLQTLPLDEYRERRAKIQQILQLLAEEKVAYVLLDENHERNRDSKYIYEPEIAKITEYPFIILTGEQKSIIIPVENELADATRVTKVEMRDEKETDVSLIDFSRVDLSVLTNRKKKPNWKDYLLTHFNLFQKNVGVFLLQTLIIAFTSFLFGYIITTFTKENAFLYVLLLLAALIVPFFVIISVFDFLEKKKEGEDLSIHFKVTVRVCVVCVILGLIFGIFLFALLTKNNIFIESTKVTKLSYVFPLLVNIPFILIPIFAKPIRAFLKKIKNKMNKTSNEEKK